MSSPSVKTRRRASAWTWTAPAAAAIVGAALVVAADVVARVARPPAELPLGAVTALVGVPFFLAQLRRSAA